MRMEEGSSLPPSALVRTSAKKKLIAEVLR